MSAPPPTVLSLPIRFARCSPVTPWLWLFLVLQLNPLRCARVCLSLNARPSAVEPRPRWAVRTMVLRVAVLALAIECVDRRRIAWIARVPGEVGVTLLAETRPRDLQQEIVDRAVRIV